MLVGLLVSTVNAFNHTKCISLNNQQCMIQPTHINLHPNKHSQGLRYYPFAIKVVIHLMTYLTEYIFQKKQKI